MAGRLVSIVVLHLSDLFPRTKFCHVMIIRNAKFAFRAFLKRPGYSFINVFGLGIGLACFALITLFVRDELSYDKHHENAEQVYRVSFRGQPPRIL